MFTGELIIDSLGYIALDRYKRSYDLTSAPPYSDLPLGELYDVHHQWPAWTGSGVTDSGKTRFTVNQHTNYGSHTDASTVGYYVHQGEDWDIWRASALAAFNPNIPVVDVPVFLFELRELPRMLRDLGDVLSRRRRVDDIPEGHLAYQFGWKPLISDLYSLLAFADEMQALRRLIRELGNDTLHTNVVEYEHPVWSDTNTLVDSGGITLRSSTTVTGVRRVWSTIRHQPEEAEGIPDLWDGASQVRALLGLELDESTIWNMIPWTWMIDWFADTGTYLDARRGGFRLELKSQCVMCEDRYVLQHKELVNTRPDEFRIVNPGPFNSSRKQRQVYTNDTFWPHANLPSLTSRQVGILSSLAITRANGRNVRLARYGD